MFPDFAASEEILEQNEDTPVPWTYIRNWQTRQFERGLDGRLLRTKTYAEYLEQTAKKILHTKRFQYSIYSDQIGVDYLSSIGLLPSSVPLPVVRRDIEDALEAHDEIERAEVTDITQKENRVYFSVDIEGTRGKTKVVIDLWKR